MQKILKFTKIKQNINIDQNIIDFTIKIILKLFYSSKIHNLKSDNPLHQSKDLKEYLNLKQKIGYDDFIY